MFKSVNNLSNLYSTCIDHKILFGQKYTLVCVSMAKGTEKACTVHKYNKQRRHYGAACCNFCRHYNGGSKAWADHEFLRWGPIVDLS